MGARGAANAEAGVQSWCIALVSTQIGLSCDTAEWSQIAVQVLPRWSAVRQWQGVAVLVVQNEPREFQRSAPLTAQNCSLPHCRPCAFVVTVLCRLAFLNRIHHVHLRNILRA